MSAPASGVELFNHYAESIGKVVRIMCREHKLSAADSEAFVAWATQELSGPRTDMLASLKDRSRPGTFLIVLLQCLLVEWRSGPGARRGATVGLAARRGSKRAGQALAVALKKISVQDRLLVRLRCEQGFSVSRVADLLDLPARDLVRRFDHVQPRLRGLMIAAGVPADEVDDLLGHPVSSVA